MTDISLVFYGISQLPYTIYLRWGVVAVMSIIFGVALVKQNKHLVLIHEEMQRFKEQDYILHAAKARGLIAFILWCLLSVFIIFNDINNEVIKMNAHVFTPQSVQTEPIKSIASATPVIAKTPLNAESSLNDIKSTYEDAFVSYMLLEGCNSTSDDVYVDLYDKLMQTLQDVDSTTLEAHNIIIAASGTYDALYAHTPCDASYLDPTTKNLTNFLKDTQ